MRRRVDWDTVTITVESRLEPDGWCAEARAYAEVQWPWNDYVPKRSLVEHCFAFPPDFFRRRRDSRERAERVALQTLRRKLADERAKQESLRTRAVPDEEVPL